MQLKEVLSPINGLFSSMPDTIWGADFDATMVDIELFTRIGTLEASPLVEHFVDHNGVLDTQGLGALLFQRYGKNWQRIWDALIVEYNIMLTTMVDETRTTNRDETGTETRDLTSTSGGTVGTVGQDSGSSVRDGSITHSDTSTLTHDVTDLETRALTGSQTESGGETLTDTLATQDKETRALTGSQTESGTEKLKDTYDEKNETDSTITYTGSEKTVTGVDEDRNLTKKNSGTVGDTGSETHTGNGSHMIDEGVYGVGGTGLANQSRSNDQETRNFTDSSTKTRTDNLTETDVGIISTDTEETKSFTGRNDRTLSTDEHTGIVTHDTTFGKSTATTDGGTVTTDRSGTESHETEFGKVTATKDDGTVTQKRTGTEGNTGSGTETYNDLTDTTSNNRSSTETRDLTDTTGGTIGTVGNETVTDSFHSEGSSPLRTFQALITEEIEGRSGQGWNFTDLIIRDVQTMITSRIWRRHVKV